MRNEDISHLLSFPVRAALRGALRSACRSGVLLTLTNRMVERWGAALGEGEFDCELINGVKMSCDLAHYIERQIYYFGAFEIVEAYLFKLMLTRGMIVVDAGANVGQYSLIAAAEVGVEGEVHAFEPEPNNFTRLLRHIHHITLID